MNLHNANLEHSRNKISLGLAQSRLQKKHPHKPKKISPVAFDTDFIDRQDRHTDSMQ
ncbi:MAG: hypothetical protein ACFCAD_10780 [Pleurocapsa sp.]